MQLKCFTGIASALELRPVTVDDMSNLRYLHTSSYRSLVASTVDGDEAENFLALVNSPYYADQILTERHFAAWLGRELVGSAGWLASDGGTRCARLSSVYVQPMFTRCGIGRRLVRLVEADARDCGVDHFQLKATENSVGFWQKMGYRAASRPATARGHSMLMLEKTDASLARVVKSRRLELV